jgi:hypothetical protein
MSSSDGLNVSPPWVRPGEGFTFHQDGDIIDPLRGKEVVNMPLHGLVHDSPIITIVQKSVKKKDVRRMRTAEREIESSIYVYGKLFRGVARLMGLPTLEDENKKK